MVLVESEHKPGGPRVPLNAFLAHSGRLQLARCILIDDWPLRRAAERFNVSDALLSVKRRFGVVFCSGRCVVDLG